MGSTEDPRFVLVLATPTLLARPQGIFIFRFKLFHPALKGDDAKHTDFTYQSSTEKFKDRKDAQWKLPVLKAEDSDGDQKPRVLLTVHFLDVKSEGKVDMNPPPLGKATKTLDSIWPLVFSFGSLDIPWKIDLGAPLNQSMEIVARFSVKVPPVAKSTLSTDPLFRFDLVGLFRYPYSKLSKNPYVSLKASEGGEAFSSAMAVCTGDHAIWNRSINGNLLATCKGLDGLILSDQSSNHAFAKFKLNLEAKLFNTPYYFHIFLKSEPSTVLVFYVTFYQSPARCLGNFTYMSQMALLKVQINSLSNQVQGNQQIICKVYIDKQSTPETSEAPFNVRENQQASVDSSLKIEGESLSKLVYVSPLVDPQSMYWGLSTEFPMEKGKLRDYCLHIYMYSVNFQPITSEGKPFSEGYNPFRKLAECLLPLHEFSSEDELRSWRSFSPPITIMDSSRNPGSNTKIDFKLLLLSNEDTKNEIQGIVPEVQNPVGSKLDEPTFGDPTGMFGANLFDMNEIPSAFTLGDELSNPFGAPLIQESYVPDYIEPEPEQPPTPPPKTPTPPPPPPEPKALTPAPAPEPQPQPAQVENNQPNSPNSDMNPYSHRYGYDESGRGYRRRHYYDPNPPGGRLNGRFGRLDRHPAPKYPTEKEYRVDLAHGDYERMTQLEDQITKQEIFIRDLQASLRGLDDALRDAQREIEHLQKELRDSHEHSRKLEKKLHEKEKYFADLATSSVESITDINLLKKKFNQMAEGYRIVSDENTLMRQDLEDLEADLDRYDELRKRYEQMEVAQEKQNKKLLELQEDNIKVQKLKSTIDTQEKVIQKLEQRLESTLQDARRVKLLEEELRLRDAGDFRVGRDYGEARSYQEGRYLQDRVKQLEMETEALRKDKSTRDRDKLSWDSERSALIQKLELAETKCQTLESQIVEQTRTFAKRLSQDKIKQTERESLANGGFGSLSGYVLDEGVIKKPFNSPPNTYQPRPSSRTGPSEMRRLPVLESIPGVRFERPTS